MKVKTTKVYNYAKIKMRLAHNNIFMTVTDLKGNVLLKKSGGIITEKRKGSKKKNPVIANLMLQRILSDLEKSDITFKLILFEIFADTNTYEIVSVLKEIAKIKYKKKEKKYKKKKPVSVSSSDKINNIIKKKQRKKKKLLPIFLIRRINLHSHNGMRGKKPRRM